METLIIAIVIFTAAIFWALLDMEEKDYTYEAIDKIEDDEKAVVVFKKTKIE